MTHVAVVSHFPKRRLKFVARLRYGDALPVEAREDGPYQVYGSNGPVGTHSRANTNAPTIIVGRKGSYGSIHYSDEAVFVIDTAFQVVASDDDIELRWLYYVLQTLGLNEGSQDSAVPGLSRDAAENKAIFVPPLSEQRAIAVFLDERTARIDALIAKKRRLLDLLAEKRRAVITHAVTRGLDPTAPLKDTGIPWLGSVPAHWEVLPLGRLMTDLVQGWSPPAEERTAEDGEWAVIKTSAVLAGRFVSSEHKALPSDVDPIESLEIVAGDVLMVRGSGSRELVGDVAYADAPRRRLMLCDLVYRLRVDQRHLNPQFLVLAMMSLYGRYQIQRDAQGMDIKKITGRTIRSLLLVKPPICEQQDIFARIKEAERTIGVTKMRIENAIACLTEYRSALITAAVTGKLDVARHLPLAPNEAA